MPESSAGASVARADQTLQPEATLTRDTLQRARPPRHLALFIRSLGGGGGAERATVNLAVEFAKRGHRVDLVLARAEGHFFDALPASVRVVDLATRTVTPLSRFRHWRTRSR